GQAIEHMPETTHAASGRSSYLRVHSLRATSCRSFFLVSTLMIGWPRRLEGGDLLSDMGELDVAVGVVRASFDLLAVDVQRVVQLAQQAADRGWAERVASLSQSIAHRTQAAPHPLLGAHRVAGCFRSDQPLENR